MTFARLQHIEERSSSPLANVQSVPLIVLFGKEESWPRERLTHGYCKKPPTYTS